MYYFGDSDDGAMHKGWLQYTDGSELDSNVGWDGGKDYDDLDELWFYFNTSTGKKIKATTGSPATKTINGNKYAFDDHGVMISDWVSSDSNSKYYNNQTQGWMERKGWIWTIPSEDINPKDNDDETYRWFYAPSSGKVVKGDLKSINGKKYIFDESGIMRSGLVVLGEDDTIVALIDEEETEGGELMKGVYAIDDVDGLLETQEPAAIDNENNFLYYFGDEETDGSMKTGKNIKITLEDDEYTFGFANNGKAYNGKESNKIYLNGVLAKASSDYRYQVIGTALNETYSEGTVDTITKISDLTSVADLEYANYVVGTSGTIVKEGKYVKDSDDGYYAVSENGEVAYFEDDEFARDKAKDFADCGEIGHVDSEDDDKWVSVKCD